MLQTLITTKDYGGFLSQRLHDQAYPLDGPG